MLARNITLPIRNLCFLLLALLLGVMPAAAAETNDVNYVYGELWKVGGHWCGDWDSGWVLKTFRANASISAGGSAEYDANFPIHITGWYPAEKVTPGETFPLTIKMSSYDEPFDPEYELSAVPGLSYQFRFRMRILMCRLWPLPPKCWWETILDLDYDRELRITEDPSPSLGDSKEELSDVISLPTGPPGLKDFVVSLNLVVTHEMKDRRVTADVNSTVTIESDLSPDDYWNYNGKELTLRASIAKCDCNNTVTFTFDTEHHYDSRPNVGVSVVFFPGFLDKTFEKDMDWLYELIEAAGYGDYTWVDNHAVFGLDPIEWPGGTLVIDPNHSYQLVIEIPVDHDPDLLPKSLDVEFVDFNDVNISYPPGFPNEAKPRFVPRLKAVVENQGCIDANAFNVAFYGVNHGQKVSRDKRVDSLGKKGEETTVWSDPIWVPDKKFKVVVDSNAEVKEMDESNNEMTEELHICEACPSALPDGTRLFDPCSRPLVIDIPSDFEPGSINIVTPIPDYNDSQLSDPVKIRDPNGNRQFVVDFSYIYDVLTGVTGRQYVVKLPGGPNYPSDPCGVVITVPSVADPCFVYEIWDINSTPNKISTERFDVIVDGTAPNAPAFVIESPSLAGDYSLRNVEVNELGDANAVMAIVHSYDGAVSSEYGPYDLNGSVNFTFPILSLRAGENTVEIVSFDDAGNRASTSRVVKLSLGFDPNDVNGPVIRIVEPREEPNDPNYVTISTPQITAYVSDIINSNIGSGVQLDTVSVTIDSNVYDVDTGVEVSPGGLVTFTPPPLSEGSHQLTVEANDLNGNSGTAQMSFIVDTNGPLIGAVFANPFVFKPRDANTELTYSLSEDAVVAIAVYAGAEVNEETYRDTVLYYSFDDNNDPNYTPMGVDIKEVYDGLVTTCESNGPGEEGCTDVDYELDDGLYTFVIRAVDRAGNEDTAEGRFEVRHSPNPNSRIDWNKSKFTIDPNSFSDCNTLMGIVTLRDGNDANVTGRVVGILPESDADGNDVFFTGGMRQGLIVAVASDVNGQILFPIERIVIGDANIQCKLLTLLADCNSNDPDPNKCTRVGGLETIGGAGHKVYITSDSVCAQLVNASNSDVNVVGQSTVCSPFGLEVTLRDSNNDPLGEVTVGVRVVSSRTTPVVDYFFERVAAQGKVTPIYTDPNGEALIRAWSTARGSPRYTVYLDRNGTDVNLGCVDVNVTSFCMECPSPMYSYVVVDPPITYAGEQADVIITLMDDANQPIANTTFAIQPLSDRNNLKMLDLFGEPVSTDPDYFEIIDTNSNGKATIPVRSIQTGAANISVKVLSVRGDTEITGGLLTVAGVDADNVSQENCTFDIDPCNILPGGTTNGVITLADYCDIPLGSNTVGLRISSNRNNRPEAPYCVDYFFGQTGQQKPILAKTTDSNGQIQVPITSNLAGTAHVLVEVATGSGWIPVGWHRISFDDTDGDNVPDDEDDYPGCNNNLDCDSDGVPDCCDVNHGVDNDADDVPDDCDKCSGHDDNQDSDGDGVPDGCDNCSQHYNPTQTDSDGDNIGNVCDANCPNIDNLNPVDFIDFSILASNWQLVEPNLAGDLDADGAVDANDLKTFTDYWLSDCYEEYPYFLP